MIKTYMNYFTAVYDDGSEFIRVKAKHSVFMLSLIVVSVVIEMFGTLIFSTDKLTAAINGTVGLVLFVGILFAIKKGHIILGGNLFVLGGFYKLVDFYHVDTTFQFYLQCLLGMIVCVAVYIKLYQLILTILPTVVLSIMRMASIPRAVEALGIEDAPVAGEILQVTIAIMIVIMILLVYDQIIRREIKSGEALLNLAEKDSLTQLYNRQMFNSHIEELKKTNTPYCMAILDIDHFKSINDVYGHLAGDGVLRTFGQLMKKTLKTYELYRWGGEEFIAISKENDIQKFSKTMDEFRYGVSQYDFLISKPVTVSIGYICSDMASEKDILVLADKALYIAKNGGRNRISSIEECDYE